MSRRVLTKFSVFLAIIVALAASQTAASASPKRTATAYDLFTGRPVFVMTTERISDAEGHATTQIEYRDTEGKLFAREEIDFRSNKITPKYSFHDLRTNMIAGAEFDPKSKMINVYHGRKSDPFSEIKRATLDVPSPAVISAGLDYCIKDNWKLLIGGESFRFQQVLPTELNFFSFSLKSTGDTTVKGRKLHEFKMQVQNFLYRMVADPIIFRYDATTRELVSFEGMFHLTDPRGSRFRVKAEFADEVNEVIKLENTSK